MTTNTAFGRARGHLARGWTAFRRDRMARADAASLSRLDDHLLRDIGLSRAEIGTVVQDLYSR